MSKIYLIVVHLVAYMQLVQLFLFLWRIFTLISDHELCNRARFLERRLSLT